MVKLTTTPRRDGALSVCGGLQHLRRIKHPALMPDVRVWVSGLWAIEDSNL